MGAGDQGVGCGVVRVRRREAERTLANKSSISQANFVTNNESRPGTRTQDVWSVRMLSWSAFPVAGESGSTAGKSGSGKKAAGCDQPHLRHALSPSRVRALASAADSCRHALWAAVLYSGCTSKI